MQIKNSYKTFLIFLFFLSGSVFYLNDFKNVIYDSEPDYLANGLIIQNYGKPLGSHHPGSINYYFVASSLYVSQFFKFNLEQTILLIRLLYFGIFLLVCYVIRLDAWIFSAYFFVCSTTYLKYVNFLISAEVILIPLSFLLYFFLANKKDGIKSSILYGIMLNIKLSSIILIPIIIYYNYRIKISQTKSFIISGLTYSLIHILSINNIKQFFNPFKNFAEQLQLISFLENFLKIDIKMGLTTYLIFIFFVVLILTSIFLILRKKEDFFSKKYNFHLFLIFSSILFFINGVTQIYSHNIDGQFIRHFAPILPFILIVFFKKIKLKYKFFSKYVSITLYLILMIIQLKIILSGKTNEVDHYISISESKIFLFQSSIFNSETEFIKHLKYRYSNSVDLIPPNWSDLTNKSEYLTTNFGYLDTDFKKKNNDYKKPINFNYNYELKNNLSFKNNFLKQLEELYLNRYEIVLSSPHQENLFESIFNNLKKDLKHDFSIKKQKKSNNLASYRVLKFYK